MDKMKCRKMSKKDEGEQSNETRDKNENNNSDSGYGNIADNGGNGSGLQRRKAVDGRKRRR